MNEYTIEEFCDQFRACESGRNWAMNTGAKSMLEIWNHPDLDPMYLIWIATRPGVFSAALVVEFAKSCASAAASAYAYAADAAYADSAYAAYAAAASASAYADAAAAAAYAASAYAAYAAAASASASAYADAAAASAYAAAAYAAYAADAADAADAEKGRQMEWWKKQTEPNFNRRKTT